jgi:hypothetical protein
VVAGLDLVAKDPAPDILFDRTTADHSLLLYVKFTPQGDDGNHAAR